MQLDRQRARPCDTLREGHQIGGYRGQPAKACRQPPSAPLESGRADPLAQKFARDRRGARGDVEAGIEPSHEPFGDQQGAQQQGEIGRQRQPVGSQQREYTAEDVG